MITSLHFTHSLTFTKRAPTFSKPKFCMKIKNFSTIIGDIEMYGLYPQIHQLFKPIGKILHALFYAYKNLSKDTSYKI